MHGQCRLLLATKVSTSLSENVLCGLFEKVGSPNAGKKCCPHKILTLWEQFGHFHFGVYHVCCQQFRQYWLCSYFEGTVNMLKADHIVAKLHLFIILWKDIQNIYNGVSLLLWAAVHCLILLNGCNVPQDRIAQLELDLDEERQNGDQLMDRLDRGREQVHTCSHWTYSLSALTWVSGLLSMLM